MHSFASETSTQSGLTRSCSLSTAVDDGEALPEPLVEEAAKSFARLAVTEAAAPAAPCMDVATVTLPPQHPSAPASEAPCNMLALQHQPDLSLPAPIQRLGNSEGVQQNAVQPDQHSCSENPVSANDPLQVSDPNKPPCSEHHVENAEPLQVSGSQKPPCPEHHLADAEPLQVSESQKPPCPEHHPAEGEPLQVSEPNKPPCAEHHSPDAEPGNRTQDGKEPAADPVSEAQGLGHDQKPATMSTSIDSVLNFQAGLGLHHVLTVCMYDVL